VATVNCKAAWSIGLRAGELALGPGGAVVLAPGVALGVVEIGVDGIGSAEHTAIMTAAATKLATWRRTRRHHDRNFPENAYTFYGSQVAVWNIHPAIVHPASTFCLT
jgi:hypothetical protein